MIGVDENFIDISIKAYNLKTSKSVSKPIAEYESTITDIEDILTIIEFNPIKANKNNESIYIEFIDESIIKDTSYYLNNRYF